MSIDLGTEFMKVAVVLPGKPMEIAVAPDSKRKTSTAIGFKNNERLFGSLAVNLASKSPENVFQSIPSLLGKSIDHPMVKLFQERYPYHNLSYDATSGQLFFTLKDGVVFSVDELVAMLFEYAHNYAELYAGSIIKTCVLTVPSHFGQAERRRLIQVSEIAGLNVLQIINDNSAVALNFGLLRFKSFNETPQYYVFFDIGSMSTTATLAAYSYGKHRDGDVVGDFPMLRIVNVSHDPTFGTQVFIYRIRDHLLEKFCEIKKLDKDLVKKSHRAMSKLALEASNVLTKLSANSEIFAQVENLFNGEDLKVKITRAEMETFCSDLFERVRRPFSDIMVDFPMESLQQVILMGGGTRIPKIQSILIEHSQKSELHRGVNSDDAAALGAVYQAAFHTPGFRVTRFIVKDYNLYPIAVDFMRAPPLPGDKSDKDLHIEDQQDESYVRQVLFPRGAIFPQKRAIKFNRHITDLDFYVNYVDHDGDAARFQGLNYNLSHITTRNVSKAAKHYSFAEPRGVKAHFIMDHNGILVLNGVSCIFHPIEKIGISDDSNKAKSTFEKIGSTLSGLFGGGDSTNVDKNVPERDTAVNTTDDDGVNSTHVNTVNITKNSSTEPFFEPIDYEAVYLDFPDLTAKELIVSQSKIKEIQSLIIPIQRRSTEIKHRAKAILSFNKTIELAQKTLNEMVELSKLFSQTLRTIPSEQQQNASSNSSEQTSEESSPWKNIFNEVEIDTLRNKMGESKTWLAESTEVLDKSPTYEDPPILVSTIQSKESELSREINYYTTKMNLWRSEIARMFAEQSKMYTTDPLKDKAQTPTSTNDDEKTIPRTLKTDEEPTTKSTEDTTQTPRPEL
ncbi:hypoxia upregulated 1 (hyou1)-related [Schistosoma mansoni]|uniref:hypoxia upregulated 1 (hyou1)-related n=1 Tax=Schistosoma mansoni TaxID=6183 RepID=UPI0001A62E75|nr:hypoxia upregulated 1 (hyou1)-related [Schistosoma mansoni]|eukprot:XP_018649369.1 hypoxia upregulated 1 (hyou1)-related [Schistosoma mansoni]